MNLPFLVIDHQLHLLVLLLLLREPLRQGQRVLNPLLVPSWRLLDLLQVKTGLPIAIQFHLINGRIDFLLDALIVREFLLQNCLAD